MSRPLHVRVAEAIGWTDCYDTGGRILVPGAVNVWRGRPPGDVLVYVEKSTMPQVPRFDIDWSATGPLIEAYLIWLTRYGTAWEACHGHDGQGFHDAPGEIYAEGVTPLQAASMFIVARRVAGRSLTPD